MALMRVNEFRRLFAPGSAPTPRTVAGWVERGELYGKRFGGRLYVDPDRAPEGREAEASEPPRIGPLHPLAARVLGKAGH